MSPIKLSLDPFFETHIISYLTLILCIDDPVNQVGSEKMMAKGSDRIAFGSAPMMMPGSAPVIIDKQVEFEEKPLSTHALDLLGDSSSRLGVNFCMVLGC